MNDLRLEDIDKVIHEPARLLIVMHLSLVEKADFLYLLSATKLSKGNLSTHLLKLENAGYVQVTKQFSGKKPQTILKLTEEGKARLHEYKNTMQNVWDRL